MLILARYPGQEIVVGEGQDEVRIKILDIVGRRGVQKVRVGIMAPKHVRVDREEIRELKDAQDK